MNFWHISGQPIFVDIWPIFMKSYTSGIEAHTNKGIGVFNILIFQMMVANASGEAGPLKAKPCQSYMQIN